MEKLKFAFNTFWRIFATIILTALFVLGSLLFAASHQYEKNLIENTRQYNNLLAQRISREIALFFDQTLLQLVNISETLDVLNLPPLEVELKLNNIILRSPHFIDIRYVKPGAQGMEEYARFPGFGKYRSEVWRKQDRDKNWISPVHFNGVNMAQIDFAVPVYDIGEPAGFLLARINLKKLWWWIDGLKKIGGARLTVVDSTHGLVVADENKQGLGKIHPAWRGKSAAGEDNGDGKKLLVSMHDIPNAPMSVIIESPMQGFSSELYEMRQTLYLFAVTLLLFTIAVAYYGAKNASKPVESLANEIIRYGRTGSGRIEVDVHSEYQVIAEAFNRMAEDTERQREEMIKQEKMATIGRFVSAMAHEVNHGLTNILSLIYRVSEGNAEAIDLARDEVSTLKMKMSDLLEFSRSGSLNIETVEAGRVLWQASEMVKCRREIQNSSIVLENQDESLKLSADSKKLALALANLVRNSIEAGGAGTTVRMSANRNNGSIEFRVTDDGPGIPAGLQKSVFEPFYTTKENGFGLGLSIAEMISSAHNGKVYIASNGAEGSGGADIRISIPHQGLETENG